VSPGARFRAGRGVGIVVVITTDSGRLGLGNLFTLVNLPLPAFSRLAAGHLDLRSIIECRPFREVYTMGPAVREAL
jgi:hypothetical protein